MPAHDASTHLGNLIRIDRPIDKDTELHPLVRWQFQGNLPEEQRRLVELPMNGRNVGNFAVLNPGVSFGSRHGYDGQSGGNQDAGKILVTPGTTLDIEWILPRQNPDAEAGTTRANA